MLASQHFPTSLGVYITVPNVSFPRLNYLPDACLIKTRQQKYLLSSVTVICDSFPSSHPFPCFLQIFFHLHPTAFMSSHPGGDTVTHFVTMLASEVDDRRLSQDSIC